MFPVVFFTCIITGKDCSVKGLIYLGKYLIILSTQETGFKRFSLINTTKTNGGSHLGLIVLEQHSTLLDSRGIKYRT